jgi:D-glycero-alpha-D-manno-heptose-7-phosphate kinase
MSRNTEYQRELHPALVNPEAERIWRIAQSHGALGWKVNGAGGDGGSVTLLCGPDAAEKRALIREIEAENPRWRSIRIGLSRTGLRVWEA